MVYIHILFMETPKYQVSVSLSILFCSDQALVEFESELFYALCWMFAEVRIHTYQIHEMWNKDDA